MKSYSTYKDSGIEWIGEIPEHWISNSIKNVADVFGGSTPKSSVAEYWDGEINWVTTDDLGKLTSKEIQQSRRMITEAGLNSCSATLVDEESIVLSTRAPIGHLGVLKVKAATNQGCKSIVPERSKADSIFLFYALLNSKEALQILGTGSTFTEISGFEVKTFKIVIPPLPEQKTIAAFLDHKTAQIDDLIAKKGRLIELLKEERAALINHAVTKGLDPDVKMKDSGIEWIGEIPEGWEVEKTKFLTRLITDGSHISPETSKEDYPFVSTVNLEDGIIDFENCLRTSTENYEYLVNTGCRPIKNDILYSKDGTIGKTALVEENYEFVVASSLIIVRPSGKALPKYLNYLLNSNLISEQVESLLSGTALRRVSINKFSNLIAILPPLCQQEVLVDLLDQTVNKIYETIVKEHKLIDILKEYKTALISEAVTGKIDVRDWQLKEA